MRKYFLLSAVALLAASNANANTSAMGTLTVSATVQHAVAIHCQNLNFGTLVLNTSGYYDDPEILVEIDASTQNVTFGSKVIKHDNINIATCYFTVSAESMPSNIEVLNSMIDMDGLEYTIDPILECQVSDDDENVYDCTVYLGGSLASYGLPAAKRYETSTFLTFVH